MADNRNTKEEAQFKAYLRFKRNYEKKLDDLDWMYDEFLPLLEDYRAGRIAIDIKKPAFELEMRDDEPDGSQDQ